MRTFRGWRAGHSQKRVYFSQQSLCLTRSKQVLRHASKRCRHDRANRDVEVDARHPRRIATAQDGLAHLGLLFDGQGLRLAALSVGALAALRVISLIFLRGVVTLALALSIVTLAFALSVVTLAFALRLAALLLLALLL